MADAEFPAALVGSTPEQFLLLEGENSHAGGQFAELDRLAASFIETALSGRTLISISQGTRGTKNSDRIALATAVSDRGFVDRTFALADQRARGAWFLPDTLSLKATSVNLAAHIRQHPWHAMTLAHEDVARTRLSESSDALVTWSLLIPLFDALLAPINERAHGSTKTGDEQKERWAEIFNSYRRLGIDIGPAISTFAYQCNWSNLDRSGQVHARLSLLDAISRHDPLQLASRFRADRMRLLIEATMKKARRGTPLARQVLVKSLQPVLAAYFGGDWLVFLDYLQLKPNPNEEVIAALPSPKLYVKGSKAASVAAERGIPADDVNAMLAAFMGEATPVSPVEQRVAALSHWWAEFDAIHARQTISMGPLWGLVEDGPYFIGEGQHLPRQQLYNQLLPPNLVTEVNRLWDGVILPRWPQTVVSEPYPHKLMAESLGPAVTVWHGIALTAWYVCEGPYSRTNLSSLREYHAPQLAALTEANTPIHPTLFDELQRAELRLGPPQDLETHIHEIETAGGRMGVRVSGGGQRREGFDILRDIISHHRVGWTRRYFQEYLDHRWNHELSGVARELHRFIAAKGKPPTFRQFARFAATAANRWFNGDLAKLYTALGEKAPETTRRIDLLPVGAHEFVNAVYKQLGGRPHDEQLRITDPDAADRFHQLARLAAASVYYVQVSEALGRAPTPIEFRANRYEWNWSEGLENGWPIYRQTIEHVRTARTT
ncbi:stress protein [Amycolatopsis balhimycina]|uniref:stress protein n=1 Tax=Amycolatopsis balhimycina TaxID=208443 RepID=UPI00039A8ED3|nr:stress protein [Amycolatopsis balhimycina]